MALGEEDKKGEFVSYEVEITKQYLPYVCKSKLIELYSLG